MFGKLDNPLDSVWRTALLWLLAAFKSTELVRALFQGTARWFDQGVTLLLFFAACLLASRRDLAANKAACKVRVGLLVLLGLSLVWSTLRTTQSVVANRMELDRLVRIHEAMKQSEARRLRLVYRQYAAESARLRCGAAAPRDRTKCADLSRHMGDIVRFRFAQPERSESAEAFRAALRARQEDYRRILLQAQARSKRLPKPVDFDMARKEYGYLEMIQWMRENPTRIEAQAVAGGLMAHGLVLTLALLLASILDLLKQRSVPADAPARADPAAEEPKAARAV